MISLVIDISLYFHCSVFWITSDVFIHLMQLTSKVQTPITFLFVNKNIKSSKKSIKEKENLLFLVNKYISSRELKTLKFSFVLRTHENSDVFKTLDEIYLVFTSKK